MPTTTRDIFHFEFYLSFPKESHAKSDLPKVPRREPHRGPLLCDLWHAFAPDTRNVHGVRR